MSDAVIQGVRVAAAHDGVAELIVTLQFENGGRSLITLDEHAASALLNARRTDNPEALIGTGWEHVRDALATASSRFATT